MPRVFAAKSDEQRKEDFVSALKKTLVDIASALVDKPEEVSVVETEESGDNVVLELSVAPEDMGKVIGKHGRIAKAIRTVMKAAASVEGKKVSVDIR